MRINGRIVFTLALLTVAIAAMALARPWPFKAAFFPLVTSIPLFVLAAVQLLIELFAKSSTAAARSDLELADDVPAALARRRTLTIFGWIAGFIALVFLLGFPIAVPLFVLAYMATQPDVRWSLKLTLTAAAWGVFHLLFVRLLHLPFEAGLLQRWLGWG